jgi:histidyl-tRNA synthetase
MSRSITSSEYKIPKGCVDYLNKDYDNINKLKNILEELFKNNGGIPLETPVFEYKSVLKGDQKLVFNLEETDGEPLTLRYDNTMPFVRFIKENGIEKIRRYTIGKVYRRDNPQLSKGRLREFYQADFDILGESSYSMLAELTLLNMIDEFLSKINERDYIIYLNDTRNLKYILCDILKLNEDYFKKVCIIVDKIEFNDQSVFSQSFEEQRLELLKFFSEKDLEILKDLIRRDTPLETNVKNNYDKLMKYINILGFADKIRFTNCLARGLDYYNGFIFEVKIANISNTVIAGGRYDNLVENSSLIGVSFGLSRLYELLKSKYSSEPKWKNI